MRIWDEGLLSKKQGGYVTNGLCLWLDGINNTRAGHDASSNKWEDLSGNYNDLTIINPNNRLSSNYYNFPGDPSNVMVLQNFGAQKITYEVVFSFKRTTLTNSETILTHNPQVSKQGQAAFFLRTTGNKILTGSNVESPLISVSDSDKFIGKPALLTVVYGQTPTVFVNSQIITPDGTSAFSTFKRNTDLILGSRMTSENASTYSSTQSFSGNMYGVRVYDRALSAKEIAQNYAEDKIRYGLE